MAAPRCPTCDLSFDDITDPSEPCPSCGNSLDQPPGWLQGGRDLRKVARIHRQLLWLVLLILAVNFSWIVLPRSRQWAVANTVGILIASLITGIQVLRLLGALRTHFAVRAIYLVLAFAPCANILVVLAVNSRACQALRKAGLKVGFMGVTDEVVVTQLAANRCRKCGYNLTGNISGRCPECGQPFAAA